MRVRSCLLAAFKACGLAIGDWSGGSGVEKGGIGISAMFA
jgi:hypothetical protein